MNKKKYILIGIIVLYATIIFLFNNHLINNDGRFHIRRMEDIYLSIQNGYPFSFIAQDQLNGFGYPTLGLYPYMLMFPFALLQFLNITPLMCYQLYIIFLIILSTLSSYLMSKELKKNLNISILYICNPFIATIFRGWVGMLAAYALLPIIFTGIYKIYKQEKEGITYLVIGMTLLLFSHILSSVLTVIVIAIYIIMNIKRLNKTIIKYMATSTIICCLTTAFVYMPIIEFLVKGNYPALMYKFDFFKRYIVLSQNNLIRAISLITAISICIYVINKNKWFSILLAILVFNTNIIPWELPILNNFLNFIQFTNRLFIFSGIPFAMMIHGIKREWIEKIIPFCSIAIFLLSAIMSPAPSSKELENVSFRYIYYIAIGDYLPENYIKEYLLDEYEWIDFDIFDYDSVLSKNNMDYQIIDSNTIKFNNLKSNLILPKLYYEGYEVKINGEKTEIRQGKYGMIEAITDKTNGIIKINYIGTTIQLISKYISFISILCIYSIWYEKHKKILTLV